MSHLASTSDMTVRPVLELQGGGACLQIYFEGGAVHHYSFVGADGTQFKPFSEAAWQGDLLHHPRPEPARHLQLIGGEWACVPFGSTQHDPDHHGFASNNVWSLDAYGKNWARLVIDYPCNHVVKNLTKQVMLREPDGTLDITLSIEVRQACNLPIGLHPNFRLPEPPERLRIVPPQFSMARSAPSIIAPKQSELQPFCEMRADQEIWHVLREYEHELVQLFDAEGAMCLQYLDEGFEVTFYWDNNVLPHCLLWFANPALKELGLGGGYQALGVEPTSSFFDASSAQDQHSHNVTTQTAFGTKLAPDAPLEINYSFTCSKIEGDCEKI